MTLCPSDKKFSMCEEVCDIVSNDDVQQAMKDKIITVRKASCDNYTSVAKFVKKMLSTS
jgi:hypothetical protein